MRDFEDHFSRRAKIYLQYRPTYPAELYSYLGSNAPDRHLAWDCGTGNGQAALGLARHFEHVIATDASSEQLALAQRHDRVQYRVARAEDAGLKDHSAGLITVAVAVHWFDLDRFYGEVRRVLLPKGLLAVWCYDIPLIEPRIDRILRHYALDVLQGYWPEQFHYIQEHYETLPFPFDELKPPEFTMDTTWDLSEVLGFLRSWSGTAGYQKQTGKDPLNLIRPELVEAWGPEGKKWPLHWTIFTRVGRVE